jgi:DNA-binding MarR family transcriptional regulator
MTSPTPPSSHETLGTLFSDVARLYWRRLEQAWAATEVDMRAAELRVLKTVVERPGERQTRLAEALFIEPMTLSGHLDRLEKRGLIERRPDTHDRRAKNVVPTADAAVALERLLTLGAAVRAAPTEALRPEETPQLRDMLVRVRAALVALDTAEDRP